MDIFLLATIIGLVGLALGLASFMLQRTTFSLPLTFFLSLAAVCCVAYFVVLFYGIRHVRYDVEIGHGNTINIPQETRLIELSPPDKSVDKPAWVDAKPRLVGDRYEISVASDPKLTAVEAQADLAEKTKAATRRYIDDLLPDGGNRVQVAPNFIADRIQRETYFEPVTLTVGEMVIAHALLVFDHGVRDEFRQQHKAAEVKNRMEQAGGIALLVLMLIGAAFGLLKLDTLTRGYYTGRLQLAAAALILGVVWAGYLLVGTAR
jgi:hypothetical protein